MAGSIVRKNNEIAAKWKEDCYHNGLLKRNIYYGNESKKTIHSGKVLIWFSKYVRWPGEREISFIDVLISEYSESGIKVFFEHSKMREEYLVKYKDFCVSSDKEAYAELACAQYIFSYGILPDIFLKRKGQKHFHIAYFDNLKADRNIRARHTISSLLSSDAIVVQDYEEKNILANIFQLSNLFEGNFIVLEKQNKNLAEIGKLLLRNEKQNLISERLKINKKKILIYIDPNGNQIYKNLLKQFLSSSDFSDIDVTTICKRKPSNDYNMQFLNELPDFVRVMYRVGSFSCDEKEYIDFQTINQILGQGCDMQSAMDAIDENILENEVERMFPNITFDSFLFFSGVDKIWYFFAKHIKATVKTKIDISGYCSIVDKIENGKLTKNAKMIIDFHNLIFDRTFFTDHRYENKQSTKDIFGECYKWLMPLNISKLDQTLLLDNKKYIVTYEQEDNINLRLQLLNIPKQAEKYYISDLSYNNIVNICDVFDMIAGNNKLCLISDDPADNDLCRNNSNIHIISRKTFNVNGFYGDFFGIFSNYICDSVKDDSPFRLACDEMGIRSIYMDNGVLKEKEISEDVYIRKKDMRDKLAGF